MEGDEMARRRAACRVLFPCPVGLGLLGIAGGSVNFRSDPSNPILAPVGPLQRVVLGQQAASLSVLQVAPSLAYTVMEGLSVALGATVNVAGMTVNPPVFG